MSQRLPEGAYQDEDGSWWMTAVTKSNPEGVDIRIYSRNEFVNEVFPGNFRQGEHISILGPTEAGKSTIGLQLLDVIATPKFRAIVPVMKRRDGTIDRFRKQTGFRLTRVWPPPVDWIAWFREKPIRGYILWPRHDVTADGGYARTKMDQFRSFRRLFYWAYQRGHCIIFADELMGLKEQLGLEDELEMIYSQGRSNDVSLMGGTQRPYDVPLLAYSSVHHLLLAYDPDKRDRDRFSQIGGGIDPQLIDYIVLRLPEYWWLHVQRRGRKLCIVGP